MGEMTLYNGGGRMAGIGPDPGHPAALAWDLRHSWFLRTPQANPLLEDYRETLSGLLDRLPPASSDIGPGGGIAQRDAATGATPGLSQPASL